MKNITKPQAIDQEYLTSRFKSNWKIVCKHKKWLEKYKNNGSVYPICLEIDPSNFCPLNCRHCCWAKIRSDKKSYINEKKLISLIKEIKKIGTKTIIWTGGGEPLANPATIKAIKLAKKLGLENGMFTNGVLLNEEKSKILVECLSWIRFNMAGSSPYYYAKTHRVNPKIFNKVCSNIKKFCDLSHGKLDIGIGTAINPQNFKGIKELPFLSVNLGVDFFQAKLDFKQVKSDYYIHWWGNKVLPYFNKVKKELKNKVRVFSDPIIKTTNVEYCHAHRIITAITANGNVAFCKMRRDQNRFFLGNIYNQSLKEIFDSKHHKNVSKKIHPYNCSILKSFCPYRTTNEAVSQYLENKTNIQNLPKGIKFEKRHINFF